MRVGRCFVLSVMVVVLAAGGLKAEAQMDAVFEDESPLIDKNAPDFKLKMLNGPAKGMAASREGKDTILFFWATWCPHCREQLKELSAQKAAIEAKGIKVLLVDIGEGAQQVQAYVDRNKVAYEIFLDEDSAISEQYDIIGVPTFIFIDKKGAVKDVDHSLPADLPAVFHNG